VVEIKFTLMKCPEQSSLVLLRKVGKNQKAVVSAVGKTRGSEKLRVRSSEKKLQIWAGFYFVIGWLDFDEIFIKTAVPTSQRTRSISLIKINSLMLFRERIGT
jgi:fructose 1,6-bisphosphatase